MVCLTESEAAHNILVMDDIELTCFVHSDFARNETLVIELMS